MTTSLRLHLVLAFCIAVASCNAPVSVHEVKPTRPTPMVLDEASLKQASKKPGLSPLPRAAAILDDLRTTYDRLAKGDSSAIPEYNYLVARFVENIRASGVKPWQDEVEIPSARTRYVLRGGQPDDLNVQERYFIACDTLEFTGEYAKTEAVKEGVGAPLLAIIKTPPTEFETFDKNLRYRGVTALVHFDGSKAIVDLADPFESEQVTIGGRRYPLHANFSDNMSYGLSETRLDKLGLSRLLNPQRFSKTCRLSRLQPYDPERIPVLMVHGLDSTPATWVPMYFKLMEDPKIREAYQFWVFSYSSGYPYPYSASLLRQELDRMNRAFPGHKDIVMIGHSMGSLVTRLMITDVDDKLWRSVFGSPPSETDISGKSRQLLEESLIFESRPEVDRAIFFSGPHRGAELATSWIGRFGSKLVRVPGFIADTRDAMVSVVKSDSSALALSRAPNSIDTLAPNNRFIMEINKHPIDSSIPFHSVMGDRGKGDTPNSSDGFVAYWSSHLDGAVSEKIVPSHHSSHAHPQGIEEARRILLEHAGLEN
ncbi:esterase/lipase family protein [Haloferula sp.]|uniref:esterase/lipase family protein n=1 Tax=Haloferula sp. TaxID=2497595 RepID=UPI00329C57AD